MSPASLASSVEWAQSALMEIEHLAATEAKVLDKQAYTNPAVCDTTDGPDQHNSATDTSDACDATDAYAQPALSVSDILEIQRLREMEGLQGGEQDSSDAFALESAAPSLREAQGVAACEAGRRKVGVEEEVLLSLQGAQQALCSQLQHLRSCLKKKCEMMQSYQNKLAPHKGLQGISQQLISSLETMQAKLKRQVSLLSLFILFSVSLYSLFSLISVALQSLVHLSRNAPRAHRQRKISSERSTHGHACRAVS